MAEYIVLTGGPGSGKSTVLEGLKQLGHKCSEEKGRKIIQQELKQSGHALPWQDKLAFRDRMLDAEIRAYEFFQHSSEVVFFDRGIIDTYGYSLLEGLEASEALLSSCSSRCYHGVFIFPPWKDIFTNDAERRQDFAEAQRTYVAMRQAYGDFGYTPILVPLLPVAERVQFILRGLGQNLG
ncbi:AAA family ATPase [Pseudodesulfovibrio sp.]|uniref:AAA family ATPase n=1 Tax=unclassified Pseudodesulfovibrio TaxID=2661612 RepID=UPI003B00DD29